MQPNASQRACTAQMLSLRTVWDPGPIHGQGPTCCSAFNPSVSAAEPLQVSTQGQRWSLDSLHRAPPPPSRALTGGLLFLPPPWERLSEERWVCT